MILGIPLILSAANDGFIHQWRDVVLQKSPKPRDYRRPRLAQHGNCGTAAYAPITGPVIGEHRHRNFQRDHAH
jgi:hypothetical protein